MALSLTTKPIVVSYMYALMHGFEMMNQRQRNSKKHMQLLLLVCVMEVLEYHIYLTYAPGVLLFAKNSLNSAALHHY